MNWNIHKYLYTDGYEFAFWREQWRIAVEQEK